MAQFNFLDLMERDGDFEKFQGLPGLGDGYSFFIDRDVSKVLIKDFSNVLIEEIADDRIELYKEYISLVLKMQERFMESIIEKPMYFEREIIASLQKVKYDVSCKFLKENVDDNGDSSWYEISVDEARDYLENVIDVFSNRKLDDDAKEYLELLKKYLKNKNYQAIFIEDDRMPYKEYSIYQNVKSEKSTLITTEVMFDNDVLGYVQGIELNCSADTVPTVTLTKTLLNGAFYEFKKLRPLDEPNGEPVDIIVQFKKHNSNYDNVNWQYEWERKIPRNSIALPTDARIYKNGEIVGYAQNIKIKVAMEKFDDSNSGIRVDIIRWKHNPGEEEYKTTYIESYVGNEFIEKTKKEEPEAVTVGDGDFVNLVIGGFLEGGSKSVEEIANAIIKAELVEGMELKDVMELIEKIKVDKLNK